MIGPFLPLQGISSHETIIDVAVTDDKMILLSDKEGAINMIIVQREHDYSFTCWKCSSRILSKKYIFISIQSSQMKHTLTKRKHTTFIKWR